MIILDFFLKIILAYNFQNSILTKKIISGNNNKFYILYIIKFQYCYRKHFIYYIII